MQKPIIDNNFQINQDSFVHNDEVKPRRESFLKYVEGLKELKKRLSTIKESNSLPRLNMKEENSPKLRTFETYKFQNYDQRSMKSIPQKSMISNSSKLSHLLKADNISINSSNLLSDNQSKDALKDTSIVWSFEKKDIAE